MFLVFTLNVTNLQQMNMFTMYHNVVVPLYLSKV